LFEAVLREGLDYNQYAEINCVVIYVLVDGELTEFAITPVSQSQDLCKELVPAVLRARQSQ
jgi:hypothetical protein